MIADALLALRGADTPVGYNFSGDLCLLDAIRNRVLQRMIGTPLTGEAGLKVLDGVTGLDLVQATETDIFGAGPVHVFSTNAACYHPEADQFFSNIDSGNSSPLAQINGSTLAQVSVYGISSSSLAASTDGRVTTQFAMCPAVAAGNNYLVSCNVRSASDINEVAVFCLSDTQMVLLYAFQIDEDKAFACRADEATFFVLGRPFNNGPDPIAFYEFTLSGLVSGGYVGDLEAHLSDNAYVSRRLAGTLTPGGLDAEWTAWAVQGPGFDQQDGNPIFAASTVLAATHQRYIFKLDRQTGALLWKAPISFTPEAFADLPSCNLRGKLALFDSDASPQVVQVIDLRDGSSTTPQWNDGLAAGPQWFDFVTGSIAARGFYAESTGPVPTYLGDYLANNGDTIPSGGWMRIYVGIGPLGQSQTDVF